MRFRSYREYTEGEVLGITFEAPSPAAGQARLSFARRSCVFFPQPTALGWTLASAEQLSVSFNIFPSMRYTQKKTHGRIHDCFPQLPQLLFGRPCRPPGSESLDGRRPADQRRGMQNDGRQPGPAAARRGAPPAKRLQAA